LRVHQFLESRLRISLLRKDTHDYGNENTNEHGNKETEYPEKAPGVLLYHIDLTVRHPLVLHLNSLCFIELIHDGRINKGGIGPLDEQRDKHPDQGHPKPDSNALPIAHKAVTGLLEFVMCQDNECYAGSQAYQSCPPCVIEGVVAQ